MSHLANYTFLAQLIATLIHYPCTVAIPGLATLIHMIFIIKRNNIEITVMYAFSTHYSVNPYLSLKESNSSMKGNKLLEIPENREIYCPQNFPAIQYIQL